VNKNELVELIEYHREKYENLTPEISDAEYDALEDQLRELDAKHPLLERTGPRKKKRKEHFKKIKHEMPMFSLSKLHTVDDFKTFASQFQSTEFLGGEKLDGFSLSLVYKKGKLKHAITRNDGYEGYDIVRNVRKMKNVKETLPVDDLSLRAEIVLLQEDFEELNKIRFEEEGKELVNLRNAIGTVKRLDGKYQEFFTVIYYNVTGEYDTELEKLEFIESLGLEVVDHKLLKTNEEASTYYSDYIIIRMGLNHDIDGLVFKLNDLVEAEKFDNTTIPKTQKAWKFPNMMIEALILFIEWNIEAGDRITPVAVLEPLNILMPNGVKVPIENDAHMRKIIGAKMGRATLSNWGWMKDKNIDVGDIILVERANDVIPYVAGVSEKGNQKTSVPTECPVCQGEVIVEERLVKCGNSSCPAKQLDQLVTWVNKLGIMNIGFSTIKTFYDQGLLKTPVDYYQLSVEKIASLEGKGEKSGLRLIGEINSKRKITLATFLAGLAIETLGSSTSEKLVGAGLDSFDKLFEATFDELVEIPDVGEVTAQKIIEGLIDRKPIILELLEFVEIEAPEVQKGNTLEGLSFCITGSLSKKRPEFEKFIKLHGGKIAGVSKTLSYLVVGENPKSKLQKAEKLGVPVIDENKLMEMI